MKILERKLNLTVTKPTTALGSSTGVLNLSLTMYPFNISTDEHVLLKFLMKKGLSKITKIPEFLIQPLDL